jgi:hypothetical protein
MNTFPIDDICLRGQPIHFRIMAVGFVWVLLLGFCSPVLFFVANAGNLTAQGWRVALLRASLSAIATMGFGWHMGTRPGQLFYVLIAAALGSTALMWPYVNAWLAQPYTPTSDNQAGAGLAMYGTPVLLIVTVLLGVPTLAGRAVANHRNRRVT